jgi:hypothetical protein
MIRVADEHPHLCERRECRLKLRVQRVVVQGFGRRQLDPAARELLEVRRECVIVSPRSVVGTIGAA